MMQDRSAPPTGHIARAHESVVNSDTVSSAVIKRFLRRYIGTIVAVAFLGALVAMIYAWMATSIYSAKAQILIESRLPQALREQLGEAGIALDSPAIESQIALLRSGKIASDVIAKLDLEKDAEFGGQSVKKGWLRSITAWRARPVVEKTSGNTIALHEAAVASLQSQIDIRRYGLSYVLDVAVSSRDPEKSAKIVNALTDAYMADQLNLKIDAARQASDWREEQIVRLRTQMNKASRAVQEYKARRDYRLPPKIEEASHQGVNPSILQSDAGKEVGSGRRDAVSLEELEVSASAYRKIYENNLQAHADAVLRQTLQFTNARVITPASTPLTPTFPRSRILAIVGALVGGMLGLGVCVIRHIFDETIKTAAEVELTDTIELIGNIPAIELTRPLVRHVMINRPHLTNQTMPMSVLKYTPLVAQSNVCRSLHELLKPLNLYRQTSSGTIIGLTAIGTSAARSMIAGGIAGAASHSGKRVLLVDLDLANRTISRLLKPDATGGIFEVLNNSSNIDDAVISGDWRAADILPASANTVEAGEQFANVDSTLSAVIAKLKNRYDLIIADLPNATDARNELMTLAPLMDEVVCIIECGVATPESLKRSLKIVRSAGVEPFGAIIYASDDVSI